MTRRLRVAFLLAGVVLACVGILFLGRGQQGDQIAVTKATPTREIPGAHVPAVVATEAAPAGGPRLVVGAQDGKPLHGEPPYPARLTADFYDSPVGLSAPCQALLWTFGDGQEESVPCRISAEAAPSDWKIEHDYANEGLYHVAARMLLVDGTAIESEKTQTVLVATAQRPTLRQVVVRWLAWLVVLLAIGLALMWLVLQRDRRRLWGATLLGLLLITFVPPFSYVPDPLGIVLAVTGGYSHDPRLPFANRFLIAGDATAELRPTLDALIGETGLDPLDATSPLARYEFVKVSREPHHTAVHVRFTYEKGAQRTYPVPLRHPADPQIGLGFYPCCWRFDGLGRLRSAHRPLAPAPFAGGEQVALDRPQRLDLPGIDARDAQNWFAAGSQTPQRRLLWAPAGDAFLATSTEHTTTTLWLLIPAENVARPVAQDVWEYGWAPNGAPGSGDILYSTVQMVQEAGMSWPQRHIMRVGRDGGQPQRLLSLPVGQGGFPGVSEQGLWFVRAGALWLLPWGATEDGARRMGALMQTDAGNRSRQPLQVSPAPDGRRVAYTCGAALCLVDATGQNRVVSISDERFVSMAWRRDGQQLAAVFWDYVGVGGRAATLRLIERDGRVTAEMAVASGGPVDAPQWGPHGRLWLQTYPQDGRRIVIVEPESEHVGDLSQPRWDAFFALHPDGDRVLLSSGRGGFWVADVR